MIRFSMYFGPVRKFVTRLSAAKPDGKSLSCQNIADPGNPENEFMILSKVLCNWVRAPCLVVHLLTTIEFVLHPQHETSYDSGKQLIKDFKTT